MLSRLGPSKNLSKSFFLSTVLVFLFVGGILVSRALSIDFDPGDEVLTLKKAIEIALKNQPNIEIQTGQLRAGEAKLGQVRGNYYPHVTLGGAYTRIWPVSPSTSSTTSLAGLPPGSNIPTGVTTTAESYEQYAATGNLSQLLFDFGRTWAQVEAQKLNTQAAKYELENTRDQVIFAVKQAYYGLLAAQFSRSVALEAIDQLKKHLEYAKALFQEGAKPKFDVTKAEVDLSNAAVGLIKAENSISLARVGLNNAMGTPNRAAYKVEQDLSYLETTVGFEEALKIALAQRPDMQAIKKQKESAAESIKAARRAHYPTVNGVASYVYVGTAFPMDHGWTAGLNLVFPLFTGFTTSYQVAEAQANLTVASGNERNLKQNIVMDLEQGFLSLREARERMRSAEVAMKQAKENLELANERYAAGLAIGVEVSDAIAAAANAQMNSIVAHYDYKIAQARIDRSTGGGVK